MSPSKPRTTPSTISCQYCASGKFITCFIDKTGFKPKILLVTKLAVTEPASALIHTREEKLWKISSNTNMVPPIDALNAAAKPLSAPHAINVRPFVLLVLNKLATPCPTVDPNCIDGPSRPRIRPDPIANNPPTYLRQRIFHQL